MRFARLLVLFPLGAASLAAQGTPATPARPVPPAAAPAPAPVSGYGAWFGSRPSMDDTGTGVMLEGVTDGSPADRAGIRIGDVLVKMGRRDVTDLAAMTEVLRAHKPGDTLDVVVRRGTDTKTLRVVLGIRP